MTENIQEWIDFGHNTKRFPNLINYVKGLKILQNGLK